jgi:hypothetical protein
MTEERRDPAESGGGRTDPNLDRGDTVGEGIDSADHLTGGYGGEPEEETQLEGGSYRE